MFKELLLAVILGALLGFGLTGGFVALKNSQKNTPITPSATVKPAVTTVTPQPSENPANALNTNNHQITIESPQNESLVANSQVAIKGFTSPGSYLIISTPSKTYLTSADNAGNFNTNIDIDTGVNQIQVDSIDSQDDQATAQFIITYSTTKI